MTIILLILTHALAYQIGGAVMIRKVNKEIEERDQP